jgi:hypothetical protein
VNFEDTINLFSTVMMAFYVTSMPFLAYFILKPNFKKLNDMDFRGRFGSLYDGLKTRSMFEVFHCVLFFIRRLFFTFNIVYFGDVPLL